MLQDYDITVNASASGRITDENVKKREKIVYYWAFGKPIWPLELSTVSIL